MQRNLLWTGREYYSLENCLVNMGETGTEITSTIIGYYQEKLYQVDYRIRTNQRWETVWVDIKSRYSNQTQQIRLDYGDGNAYRYRQKIEFLGICMARIRDGKIAEVWKNYDFLSMYQQSGQTLTPNKLSLA